MKRAGTLPEEEHHQTAGRRPEVILRAASAIVLAALTLAATLYRPWSFLILVMIGGGLVAWEWGRLTRGSGFDGTALLSAVSIAAVAILAFVESPDLAALIFIAAAVAISLTAPSRAQSGWAVAGLAYAAFPAFALVWLRGDAAFGALSVVYLFAVAWTTDTASYCAGRLIGGRKLAPGISPQKTWSGFFVGALVPALVGVAFAFALERGSVVTLAVVSLALALACQAGDLVESWVKRRFGAKDMSQLIPGHGGLLDRIDGLLFAAVLAGLIALRDPANPGQALLIW